MDEIFDGSGVDEVFWVLPTPGGGGGLLPYKRLMRMCRWMGSHFHDWVGVAFSIVTRMGLHIFGFLGIQNGLG